jgi:DNA helicase-2/ATP-dependent DNA helicase PcrA
LKDIAVFYRVNAMSRVLEEAFIRNEIPYQIIRGVEFYNRKEIRDVLAYLKILVNPDDEIALLRIINIPARGIGKTTIDRIRAYAVHNRVSLFDALKRAEHIESLSKAPKAKLANFINMLEQFKKDITSEVALLAERIFIESGLVDSLNSVGDQNAIDNVNELISSAAQYDQSAEGGLLDYLQQISLFSDVDAYDTTSERVALMTLHAAKGLEFENVFIVGLEEGLLPHERRNTDENEDERKEEERRLFFVGITRAKVSLYISFARYRTVRGQMLRSSPSPFLYELGIDLTESDQESEALLPCDTPYAIRDTQHDFTAGQMVLHKTFGKGMVEEFIDMGENSVVVVKFGNGQTKSLMVKYADLSKI